MQSYISNSTRNLFLWCRWLFCYRTFGSRAWARALVCWALVRWWSRLLGPWRGLCRTCPAWSRTDRFSSQCTSGPYILQFSPRRWGWHAKYKISSKNFKKRNYLSYAVFPGGAGGRAEVGACFKMSAICCSTSSLVLAWLMDWPSKVSTATT